LWSVREQEQIRSIRAPRGEQREHSPPVGLGRASSIRCAAPAAGEVKTARCSPAWQRGRIGTPGPAATHSDIQALYLLVNLAIDNRLAYYNGNALYLRAHVMRFHVECSGFGYQAEFLTRLISEGATYKELPLVAYDREGSTALNVKNLLSVTHSLMAIALRRMRIVLFE
jgi:hypothetical protein